MLYSQSYVCHVATKWGNVPRRHPHNLHVMFYSETCSYSFYCGETKSANEKVFLVKNVVQTAAIFRWHLEKTLLNFWRFHESSFFQNVYQLQFSLSARRTYFASVPLWRHKWNKPLAVDLFLFLILVKKVI